MSMEREMAIQMQRVTNCRGCIRALRENKGAPVPGCKCWQTADEIFAVLRIMPSDAKVTLADFLLEGTLFHVTKSTA